MTEPGCPHGPYYSDECHHCQGFAERQKQREDDYKKQMQSLAEKIQDIKDTEITKLREQLAEAQDELYRMIGSRARAQAHNAELVKGLRKYGQHQEGCEFAVEVRPNAVFKPETCTCGLDEAIGNEE